MRMTPADHEVVTAAIAAAEARTDGEIMAVVAAASDSYRDAALQYAVLAMLAVPAVLALLPQSWMDDVQALVLGWNGEWTRGSVLQLLLVTQIIAFLAVRGALSSTPLLMALTPGATKTRRVRRRAIALFRGSLEQRTRGRTGILIYLSLAEHRAEIVADAAINEKVESEAWGAAMAALVAEVKAGRAAGGMALAIEKVGAVLAEHLPRSLDDTNELPDRLIEL